eukprot:14691475-Alexandrium_andersonii.AAC.1
MSTANDSMCTGRCTRMSGANAQWYGGRCRCDTPPQVCTLNVPCNAGVKEGKGSRLLERLGVPKASRVITRNFALVARRSFGPLLA